jgi:hypothetical protein
MKKNLLIALLFTITIVSCKTKAALDYNQKLVGMENSLTSSIMKTETDVEKYAQTKNWDSIVAVSTRMESMIDEKLQKVKSDPAPDAKDGEKFKAAYVYYFDYCKGMYTKYKLVGGASNDELRKQEAEKLMEYLAKKDKVIADLKTTQAAFATANNLRMEKK